ncbi:DUF397 domain-containing protein [Streptomyces sp. NPDC091649]|uniref:DUF397 domain-containing protein n=1 Tax=Streptomyces sp. NPDC091649 TaxID=3366004 RepID=UPI0038112E61
MTVSGRRRTAAASTLTGGCESSYSGGDRGECLEAARGHAAVPVRDSKSPAGPVPAFSARGRPSFATAVKRGGLSACTRRFPGGPVTVPDLAGPPSYSARPPPTPVAPPSWPPGRTPRAQPSPHAVSRRYERIARGRNGT